MTKMQIDPQDVAPAPAVVCAGCGHRPVCHRRGPCEHVKREGWLPQHFYFTQETPCTCQAWQDSPPEPKPRKGK